MLCAGLCVFASTSVAEDAKIQTLDRPQDANRAADLDDQTSGTNIRASQLTGMNIENSAEENVGEINDELVESGSMLQPQTVHGQMDSCPAPRTQATFKNRK